MGLISGSVTITATGTPQSVSATMQPGLPSISINGITYPAGSATQRANQINLQAALTNTAPVSVGTKAMVAGGSGVGVVLAAGASDTLGQFGAGVTVDDVYVMGTAADKVYVQLVS